MALETLFNMTEAKSNEFNTEQRLLVHNFPQTFSERDIHELLQLFEPVSIEMLMPHRAAYVTFSSQQHANYVLKVLHQQLLDGRRLYVEYADGKGRHVPPKLQQIHVVDDQRNDLDCDTSSRVLQKLYATADHLDFNQPPPPYLHYNYPLVNRDIVDAICIALETSRKFYVQVLHLMNRMNLEPPFVAGDRKLQYEMHDAESAQQTVMPTKDVSTQTEEIVWQHFVRNKRKRVASNESELETTSSDNEETLPVIQTQQPSRQKQRRLPKMQRIQLETIGVKKTTTSTDIDNVFESPQTATREIRIIAPKVLQSKSTDDTNADETFLANSTQHLAIEEITSNTLLTDAQIRENRIPADQLTTHPLFQNYEAGAVTNRLYIKNIAKDVTEQDLRAIYCRYLEDNCNGVGNVRSIDIRLMQTGRMKGQAFITFAGPYLECDDSTDDSQKYQMITRALTETNGLILKDKVLVVVYGKKK